MERSPMALHLNMLAPPLIATSPKGVPFLKSEIGQMSQKRSFREDIDRTHQCGVSCMPKAHKDSKPFFPLNSLRWVDICWTGLAHMDNPGSRCWLLLS